MIRPSSAIAPRSGEKVAIGWHSFMRDFFVSWCRQCRTSFAVLGVLAVFGTVAAAANAPFQISGIYPHLAVFNDERECGTGAVVPWADRLWVVTYAPHMPKGSSDKLYEITADLQQI